jgi:hypothetical protein
MSLLKFLVIGFDYLLLGPCLVATGLSAQTGRNGWWLIVWKARPWRLIFGTGPAGGSRLSAAKL